MVIESRGFRFLDAAMGKSSRAEKSKECCAQAQAQSKSEQAAGAPKTEEKPKVKVFKKDLTEREAPKGKCPFDINIPDKYSTHPGGESMLELGRMSTRPDTLFLSYHCGYDLDGKVAAECKRRGVRMPERGPLYNEVHEAILKVRREHPGETYVHFAWILLVSFMTFYCFITFTLNPTLMGCLSYVFWFLPYAYNVFHTRNHKGAKIYDIPWLDNLTKPFYEAYETLFVITPRRWQVEHNLEHHIYTNAEVDSDIYGLFPFFRINHSQEHLWFHKYQAYYCPFVASLSGFIVPIDNLFEELKACKPGEAWYPQAVFAAWLAWFSSFYYTGGWAGIGYVTLYFLMVGIANFYFFQVSHNQNGMGNDSSGEWENIDEWIKLQFEESMSWGGYWATLYSGALNLQIEHHMSPGHDTTYYYYLMPELQKICKKHNIPYNYRSSFWTSVWDFHQFLGVMGNP